MFLLVEYSGLIRNHVQLAGELGVDISRMRRHQREELLVSRAYERWGEQMGGHINGQFAAVFRDDETGEVFATRDILGAELLFFCETREGLACATCIKDILSLPGVERRLNEPAVQILLEFAYVPGNDTLFTGVRKLAPGGWLRWRDGKLLIGSYGKPAFSPDKGPSLDEWADEIEHAMKLSLADMLDPGEEYGSFLSSGVDSSYILAASDARCGYCCSYGNNSSSEAVLARETAEFLGRDFREVELSQSDVLSCLDEFLLVYEQPSADIAGLALYAAAKEVAKTSSVCLSGEGADELFAGYGVYSPSAVRKARLTPGFTYKGTTHIMNEDEVARYLKLPVRNGASAELMRELTGNGLDGLDDVSAMLYTDLVSYFEGSILFNATKIAKGTGLDIRMPYCDLRMLDIAMRMPSEIKVSRAGNKRALRRAAARRLPEAVAYRMKMGFPVPVEKWMRSDEMVSQLREAFASDVAAEIFDVDEINALLDAFLGEKPRVSHPIWFFRHKALLWRHIWTIFVFIRWHRLFF